MFLLEALKEKTQLAADTASLSEIKRFGLQHATNNPSLIRQAVSTPEYQSTIAQACKKAQGNMDLLFDLLLVGIGTAILETIPGTLSTQIDPQITFDTEKIVARCRRLISLFEDAGADCNRVILKIPASWEGIAAVKDLEKEGIRCNITLIFSLSQASAAFEAKATMIAPYVGRVTDWCAAHSSSPDVDHGVLFVQQILAYAKQLGCETQVMAASFRSIAQIMNLTQSHYLTIEPKLLASLAELPAEACSKIELTSVPAPSLSKTIDAAAFQSLLSQDKMASTLFIDGLKKFTDDYNSVLCLAK
ncbi:MAG: transaldolase [Verrucomicrobia bacterium]|nr:transaldolase [Verrucomicrobiota bacterium]